MNFQHIQALRQLNTQRKANTLPAGSGFNQQLQQMSAQYRNEEVIFDQIIRGTAASSDMHKSALKNAMSTTTGSQGGYAVPATVAVSIADALNQYSSVRRMSTVVVTSTGETTGYPSSDGRSETGEQLDENAQSADMDLDFNSAPWPTFKYSSKLITVPMELVQDSSIDMVGFLERRIAARIGRITNAKFTTGVGSTEPRGIATAAPIGKTGASGQVATVTPDDLDDLVGSVDAAYRESLQCGWMMNDATLLFISKLKDPSGRPLKLVKYGSRAANVPTTLLGFPVEINPDMPVMAAGAKSILFGDFSSYVVRDVAGIAVYRFSDSAFLKKGQVGFLGLARAGGAYVDVGGAIKAYQNSAT